MGSNGNNIKSGEPERSGGKRKHNCSYMGGETASRGIGSGLPFRIGVGGRVKNRTAIGKKATWRFAGP